mgnify:CR=1 FL=1
MRARAKKTRVSMRKNENFEEQLDLDPGNWDVRLVYSDWLEEQGELEYASYLRWTVRNKKRPYRIVHYKIEVWYGWTCPGWGEIREEEARFREPPGLCLESELPSMLYEGIKVKVSGIYTEHYWIPFLRDRGKAEAVLREVLIELKMLL